MHYLRRVSIFMLGVTILGAVSLRGAESEPKDMFITLTRTPLETEKLPSNVSIIKSEAIQKLSIQNAGDAVEYLASVDVPKNAGAGSSRLPKIRGFLNKQIAVYIDNRRVPPDVTGNVDLSIIPAEQIDRIEVLRGGASVLYGPNAEGGVIHIITKRAGGALPTASVSVTAKSFGTDIVRAEGGHKHERFEAYAAASRMRSDGYMQNSRFENQAYSGNAGYDFGRPGKTSVDFIVNRSEREVPAAHRSLRNSSTANWKKPHPTTLRNRTTNWIRYRRSMW